MRQPTPITLRDTRGLGQSIRQDRDLGMPKRRSLVSSIFKQISRIGDKEQTQPDESNVSTGWPMAASDEPGDPYTILSARLGDYPPDPPLHRGDPRALTREQRAENLAAFLDRNRSRIAIVIQRLACEGLDGVTVLKGGNAALGEGRKIDAWLSAWVPKRAFDLALGDPGVNAPRGRWFASDRAGTDLVFSFVLDLARLNAAALTATDPSFSWTVVEDEHDAGIAASPAGRLRRELSDQCYNICLVRDAVDGPAPRILNLPLAMLGLMHGRMSPLAVPVHPTFPFGL